KRMDNQVLQACFGEQLLLFGERVKQFDAVGAGEYHSRMREKREDDAFAARFSGVAHNAIDDFFVTDVNAVESPDCDGGFFLGAEVLYGVEYFQTNIFTTQI